MQVIENFQNMIQLKKALKAYGDYYLECRKTFRSLLNYYVKKKRYNVSIWGGGLKGKSFLKVIDPTQKYIKYVYDIDENKIGKRMPTGHLIVDYTKKNNQDVQIILLMNSNFETETQGLIEEQNMNAILINTDSIITGNLSAEEVIKEIAKGYYKNE